jgi:CRP/FNR family transcriptional regulator, cyclic AMP receptor protein
MGTSKDPATGDAWVEDHGWICPGSEMFLKYHKERVDVLRKVPLFSGLGVRHLDLLARDVREKNIKAGGVLARQGKREHDFMLILDGTARVERDGHDLAHLKAGDFCGEMSLIDGQPRSATVSADSPCVVLVLDGRSFRGLLDSVPELQKKILLTLCQRLRDADTALAGVN